MKDCTRKDVVSANLRREQKDIKDVTKHPNLHWELKRKSMNNSTWLATDASLVSSSEQSGCNLDVSIVYENTLKKFIHEFKFNSQPASDKQPSNLASTIVSDLNTLSSLASDLAQKLSESHETTSHEQIVRCDIPNLQESEQPAG
jgi:hypothetical protein